MIAGQIRRRVAELGEPFLQIIAEHRHAGQVLRGEGRWRSLASARASGHCVLSKSPRPTQASAMRSMTSSSLRPLMAPVSSSRVASSVKSSSTSASRSSAGFEPESGLSGFDLHVELARLHDDEGNLLGIDGDRYDGVVTVWHVCSSLKRSEPVRRPSGGHARGAGDLSPAAAGEAQDLVALDLEGGKKAVIAQAGTGRSALDGRDRRFDPAQLAIIVDDKLIHVSFLRRGRRFTPTRRCLPRRCGRETGPRDCSRARSFRGSSDG